MGNVILVFTSSQRWTPVAGSNLPICWTGGQMKNKVGTIIILLLYIVNLIKPFLKTKGTSIMFQFGFDEDEGV